MYFIILLSVFLIPLMPLEKLVLHFDVLNIIKNLLLHLYGQFLQFLQFQHLCRYNVVP